MVGPEAKVDVTDDDDDNGDADVTVTAAGSELSITAGSDALLSTTVAYT